MVHGYPLIKTLCAGLQSFMTEHGFNSIEEFRGASLPYFTTHADLVSRQADARMLRKEKAKIIKNDKDWSGDQFTDEVQSMIS